MYYFFKIFFLFLSINLLKANEQFINHIEKVIFNDKGNYISFPFYEKVLNINYNNNYDPDIGVTTVQLIKSRNYDVQIHKVISDDGYILTLHRIINKNFYPNKLNKLPVLLHHGLMGSSIDFVINSPGGSIDENTKIVGNNLGFELSKRSYDVWLANSRGNMYSNEHITLDSKKDVKYWNFSLDEQINYDLPRVIDYIKNETNSSTVSFIGHSLGTTVMFAMLSRRTEYVNVIKPFIALAPFTIPLNAIAPVVRLGSTSLFLKIMSKRTGSFIKDKFIRSLAKKLCRKNLGSYFCANIAFIITGGFDSHQVNYTRIPVYTSTESYGTSIKTIVHMGQIVRNNRFAYYDYGSNGNMLMYNNYKSPIYPLENIKSNDISLFSSLNDGCATRKDVLILKKQLKNSNIVNDYVIPYNLWSHLDFIWGKDAAFFVNEPILNILTSYN